MKEPDTSKCSEAAAAFLNSKSTFNYPVVFEQTTTTTTTRTVKLNGKGGKDD
jgi:hypothetical protein